MRSPDFRIFHRTSSSQPETHIRFTFTPPRDVIERLRFHGFTYLYYEKTWLKPGLIEEHSIRAIVENWPDS